MKNTLRALFAWRGSTNGFSRNGSDDVFYWDACLNREWIRQSQMLWPWGAICLYMTSNTCLNLEVLRTSHLCSGQMTNHKHTFISLDSNFCSEWQSFPSRGQHTALSDRYVSKPWLWSSKWDWFISDDLRWYLFFVISSDIGVIRSKYGCSMFAVCLGNNSSLIFWFSFSAALYFLGNKKVRLNWCNDWFETMSVGHLKQDCILVFFEWWKLPWICWFTLDIYKVLTEIHIPRSIHVLSLSVAFDRNPCNRYYIEHDDFVRAHSFLEC